jgi:hypothetical protein
MEQLTYCLQQEGVLGLVFHRGETIVSNHFPGLYAQSAIGEMCAAITTACTGYARVGRYLTQQMLLFGEGTLLILACPPANREVGDADESIAWPCVTVLLENPSAALRLLGPVRAFLQEQALIDQDAWQRYQLELIQLLSKVINRGQAQKLITRVQSSFSPEQSSGLPRNKFAAFGQALVREVPNRSKHAFLNAAITKLIAQLDAP